MPACDAGGLTLLLSPVKLCMDSEEAKSRDQMLRSVWMQRCMDAHGPAQLCLDSEGVTVLLSDVELCMVVAEMLSCLWMQGQVVDNGCEVVGRRLSDGVD